jgi:hypothetical protein
MFKLAIIGLVGALCATHALAVNKCTGADGKISFQDGPCTGVGGVIKVTPASGHSISIAPAPAVSGAPVAGATPDKPQNATEKQYEALKSERIRREKWLAMNDSKLGLSYAIAQCDREQQQLSESKGYSANNLAGATRDVSIAQTMTAAATACANRVRVKEKEVEAAEKVCQEIKCIAAF